MQDLLPSARPSATASCRSTTAPVDRLNAALAGRPDLMAGRTSLTVYPGMTGDVGERPSSASRTVRTRLPLSLKIPTGGAEGVRPLPRREVRRMEPLLPTAANRSTPTIGSVLNRYTIAAGRALRRRKGHPAAFALSPMAGRPAPAAPARSSSMASKSPKDGSPAPSLSSSGPAKGPTWAWTWAFR